MLAHDLPITLYTITYCDMIFLLPKKSVAAKCSCKYQFVFTCDGTENYALKIGFVPIFDSMGKLCVAFLVAVVRLLKPKILAKMSKSILETG